ncbi:unnamed protein product [Moneuplotes crassus]|uniref:Splicing factor YJU2 n=1 Tax=Euplotes crassus TaxID=5936 RepID=A0AAD2D1V7_EUPCR|nr:unnamed protein product [Moneuplotes crassus]
MAERKVLVKYYPPDFDPDKLYKAKKLRDMVPKKEQSEGKKKGVSVRMMLPMSVRCKTCGEFMKIGTKFNMRKATVEDEDYLGIAIYRFHWKCKRCSGELTMKTDPKNSDYVCEFGATRNYEPWRDQRCAETAKAAVRKLEEQNDILKSLENKTYDSKREMEILDNLEEVRHLNKRHANVNHEDMIEASRKQYMQSLQEDVLQKDAKEQFSKLRRKREEMMEQDAIFERKEEDDEKKCNQWCSQTQSKVLAGQYLKDLLCS